MTPEKSTIMAKHARSVVICKLSNSGFSIVIFFDGQNQVNSRKGEKISFRREKEFIALFRWAMDMKGTQ